MKDILEKSKRKCTEGSSHKKIQESSFPWYPPPMHKNTKKSSYLNPNCTFGSVRRLLIDASLQPNLHSGGQRLWSGSGWADTGSEAL